MGSFETLSLDYVPEEEGKMMIYTSNQTAEPLDVFMDDMMVLHNEGPIVRVDDYYPFGMNFNSSERSGFTTNKYLYNGKELQSDLDLDWYDYGARFYDASLGRWGVVDALADDPNQIDKSPYAYAWNSPTNLIDPDGNCPDCPDIIKEEIEQTLAPIEDAVEKAIDFAGDVMDKIGEGIDKAIKKMTPKYGEELTSENGGVDPTTEEREIVGQQTTIDDLSAAAGGAVAGPFKKPSGAEILGKIGEAFNQILKPEIKATSDSTIFKNPLTGEGHVVPILSNGNYGAPQYGAKKATNDDSVKYELIK